MLFPSLLSRRPSLCTTFSSHKRGESEWISLRLMDSPTFLSIGVQHALVIYTLLPVRIKTNNIYAKARRNPGDPRSRTEDPQMLCSRPGEIQETHAAGLRPGPLMSWCMTSTLVAIYFASCSLPERGRPRMDSISSAFFSVLHSSVRYLLFLNTLLGTVYFVVSRRCMMQPIIFLLLIVVRLTQKIFFLSSASLFPLDP